MPKVTSETKLKNELAKAKKTITALKKELKATQTQCLKEMGALVEDAFITGYTEALDDIERKNSAMEKFMNQSLKKFDKEYEDKLIKVGKVTMSKKVKKPTKRKSKK